MGRIIEKQFKTKELCCPVCGFSLAPPVAEYCEHIAFYCVQGPADDPFIEYQVHGMNFDLDNISSDEKLLEIGAKHTLTIFKFAEEDAYYPATIFLGICNQHSPRE